MSTENQQTDQLPPKDFSEPDSNLQNPPENEHPEQPQKKEFIPDTIDHVKNMIQPLNDNISDINLMFENGNDNKNENLFLIPDKDKNKESQNMFGNNGGKSILNENPNMSNIFNTSPIKSSNLFKKENEEVELIQ